jgi:hypothetical protein
VTVATGALTRWQRWVALTSRKERGTTIALFRIAVGAVMLVSILSVAWSGALDALWIDAAYGGMRHIGSDAYPVLLWLGGARPSVVWMLVGVTPVLCAAMILGIGGRWTVLAAAISYKCLSYIGWGSGGYDLMISNAVWLLFLSDSTATLSLDCRSKHGSWTSDTLVSAWPRYLVIVQLVVIYTFTGFQKTSATWTFADSYSALYWFMQDPTWPRIDMGWLAWVYPLTQIATFATWHFEVTAPVLLLIFYFRATRERPGRLRAAFNHFDLRKPWAAIGIGMHMGIAAMMNMGPFSWISMAYYLSLWHPDELPSADADAGDGQ